MSGQIVISQQQQNNETITTGVTATEHQAINVVSTGVATKIGSCPIFRYNYAMNSYRGPFKSNAISNAFEGKFCCIKCASYWNEYERTQYWTNSCGYFVLVLHLITFILTVCLIVPLFIFETCTVSQIKLCEHDLNACECQYSDIDTYNDGFSLLRYDVLCVLLLSLIWFIYYGMFVYVILHNCRHSKNIFALNFKARESDFYDTNEHLKVSFNQWNQMTGFAMRQNNAANARLIEAGLVTLHTKKRNTYSYV